MAGRAGTGETVARACIVCVQVIPPFISPAIPPPGGAGGWRESPHSRHSTTNIAVRRRPRSTLKIYRINNKVEWKVKYASLSYFTG
jgi:hypothetical protein